MLHAAVASEALLLVYTVARVLHANDVDFELLDDLVHERLRQRYVLTIRVKMEHHFLRLAFEEQTRDEIFTRLLLGSLLGSLQPLPLIHKVPLRLELSLGRGADSFRLGCRGGVGNRLSNQRVLK